MGRVLSGYLSRSSMVPGGHYGAAKPYGAERTCVDGSRALYVGGIRPGVEEATPCVFHHHWTRPWSRFIRRGRAEQCCGKGMDAGVEPDSAAGTRPIPDLAGCCSFGSFQ